jgi:hypothetical protein
VKEDVTQMQYFWVPKKELFPDEKDHKQIKKKDETKMMMIRWLPDLFFDNFHPLG